MTKAEQEWSLIEALEHCKKKRPFNKSCAGCPYAGFGCGIDAAIEKLKAQEPRVMTLEEVLATEVVYAEDIDKAEIIPVLVSRRAHDRIVLVRAHLMGSPSHVIYPLISEYGKRWRCWTSRPDEKRRDETPWE